MNSHLLLLPQSNIAKGHLLTQLIWDSVSDLINSSVKSRLLWSEYFPPFKTNILPPSVITLLYLIQYKKSSYSYLNLTLQGYSKQCFSSYSWWKNSKKNSWQPQVTFINCCSDAKLCLTLCDPMDSTPGFLVLHHILEFAQTHIHWVRDAIQSSHPLSSPSPPAFNLSQH